MVFTSTCGQTSSFLVRMKTPPPVSLSVFFLSLLKTLYLTGKTSLFPMSGVSHDSVPSMTSGSVVVANASSSGALFLMDLQLIIAILMLSIACFLLPLALFLLLL